MIAQTTIPHIFTACKNNSKAQQQCKISATEVLNNTKRERWAIEVREENETKIMLLSISSLLCAFTGATVETKSSNNTNHLPLIHFSSNTPVHIGVGHCHLKEHVHTTNVLCGGI